MSPTDDPGPSKEGTRRPAPRMSFSDGPKLVGGRRPRTVRNGPASSKRRQFGLRHLMLLSVYFAVLFLGASQAINTGREEAIILTVVVAAAGLIGFGLWLATRLDRFVVAGWAFFFIGLTGASIVLVGWLTILLIPAMIAVTIHLVARRRATQQESLLWVLALAADRGRPFGPALDALAEQLGGVYRRRARQVADCLDHGMPLPDALDFVRKAVSPQARVLIRVGHDSGQLAEAIKDAASARSARPAGWQSFGTRVGYLCLVFAVVQSVVSFIMVYILPKYQAIFKDFGVPLPEITLLTIQVTEFMTLGGNLIAVFPIVELLLLLYLFYAFSGYSNLHVPILDRLFARRHSVLILRCLAMIVEGERPIPLGLQILSRWYPTRWVRKRIVGADLATRSGVDWIDALVAFRLISRSDAALLESARRAGNLPWALRELAEGSARRLNYRLQAASQVLTTLLLLALGGLVGFFAVAYFLPLTTLIERLVG